MRLLGRIGLPVVFMCVAGLLVVHPSGAATGVALAIAAVAALLTFSIVISVRRWEPVDPTAGSTRIAIGTAIAERQRKIERRHGFDSASFDPLRLRGAQPYRPVRTELRDADLTDRHRARWPTGVFYRSAANLVIDGAVTRAIIVGDAGSGKTTFGLMLAGGLLQTEDAPQPILLSLSSWDPDTDFVTWIDRELINALPVTRCLPRHAAGGRLQTLLRSHRYMLILDEFERLSGASAATAVKALQRLCPHHQPMFLLTRKLDRATMAALPPMSVFYLEGGPLGRSRVVIEPSGRFARLSPIPVRPGRWAGGRPAEWGARSMAGRRGEASRVSPSSGRRRRPRRRS